MCGYYNSEYSHLEAAIFDLSIYNECSQLTGREQAMAHRIQSSTPHSDTLGIRADQIGKYILLPGDPGRVPFLAGFFDDPYRVAENWTHMTYTGTLEGVAVSVVSTDSDFSFCPEDEDVFVFSSFFSSA